MRLLLLVSLAAATAVAQTVIDYSKVPDCARQCTVLGQAETGCVPSGGAPVTDQNTYQSCFCQSALLTTLKTSGALCQSVCSPDDATKISQFYVSLCNGPVQPAPAATTTVATTTPSTATTSTQTGGTTNGATAGNNVVSSTKKSWIDTHWKWVVGIAGMIVGMLLFWLALWWVRNHYRKKHNAERTNLAAHDAPYIPPTPAETFTSDKTAYNHNVTPMSGTRNGTPSAGVSKPPAMRSRSSTLQSLRLGNGSRANVSQPVAWGPHQHLAYANVNGNGSPGNSVPPSPTQQSSFRNREAMRSDPRFSNYNATPPPTIPESTRYATAHDTPGHVNWTSTASHENGDRPKSTNPDGESFREVKRHTLSAVKSDPHVPQSAEFGDISPQMPDRHANS